MDKIFWVFIFSLIVFCSCVPDGAISSSTSAQNDMISPVGYYYDSVHDVGIWRYKYGEAIFVLPASQFKNKELPIGK